MQKKRAASLESREEGAVGRWRKGFQLGHAASAQNQMGVLPPLSEGWRAIQKLLKLL